MNIIPVIISGGSGSRLWPLSTKDQPKPFIPLFEDENLLEKTIQRLEGLFEQIIFVCNQQHLSLHQKVMQKKKIHCSYLLEEKGKNTAPAVLMAARVLEERGLSKAIMLVLPADQFILEKKKFQKAVQLAAQQAKKKGLITFGIKPSYPETGYGYLYLKNSKQSVVELKQFVEKPNLEKAKEFLKQKNYFWNSGIFCFSVQSIIQAFEKYQPQDTKNSLEVLQNSKKQSNLLFFHSESFQKFSAISLDYAIMEKHNEVFAVRANFQWSDIGNWYSVAKIFPKDKQGNIIQANSFGLENKNIFLLAKKNFFGLLGLEDISIVESEQGILIAHNSKLQEVKKIFQYINQKKKSTIMKKISIIPEIVEFSIEQKKKYSFFCEQSCNLINTSATATSLLVDNKTHLLKKNEGIFLTKGKKITFENTKKEKQKWIRIQSLEKQESVES